MNSSNDVKRNSNFELLRIISMFMIVLGHFIVHGNMIHNSGFFLLKLILQFMMCILIVHVNSFVILTGYFQHKSKVKVSKIIKLVLQVIFYSLVILLVFTKFHIINITSFDVILTALPSIISNYWFITSYLILYALSDYINMFINNLSKQHYSSLLLLCFVIFSIVPFLTGRVVLNNNGYNFYHFIFLYMLGAYLYKYPLKESFIFKKCSNNRYRIYTIVIFIVFVLLNFLIDFFATNIINKDTILNFFGEKLLATRYTYARPFIILQSIAFFEIFTTFKFNNSFVNKISQSVIAVYLISDNFYVRSVLYKFLKTDDGIITNYNIVYKIILYSISIFIICIIIDKLRKYIIKLFQKIKIIQKLSLSFKKLDNKDLSGTQTMT